jgi:hypothetical protein
MKVTKPKIHSGHVENAVAALLNPRVFTIVPNVSWGLGLRHECDMLALSSDGYFTEIEIKISVADAKKDLEKWHGHKSNVISRLVYAFPIELKDKIIPYIPEHAGMITVHYNESRHTYYAKWLKVIKYDKSKKPDQKTIEKFYQLGCMRIWSLKQHNYNLQK